MREREGGRKTLRRERERERVSEREKEREERQRQTDRPTDRDRNLHSSGFPPEGALISESEGRKILTQQMVHIVTHRLEY